MRQIQRIVHGSVAWFEMVGTMLCEAAAKADLPASLDISLVERYRDGAALPGGLVQGLRFNIVGGVPSFRVGAGADEGGDITVEVTAAASQVLNSLYAADPDFVAALARFQRDGALRIDGDPGRLGPWFAAVHDAIVERTK